MRRLGPPTGSGTSRGKGSRSGSIVVVEAAGAGSAPCSSGPAPPAPDAGEDTAAAESAPAAHGHPTKCRMSRTISGGCSRYTDRRSQRRKRRSSRRQKRPVGTPPGYERGQSQHRRSLRADGRRDGRGGGTDGRAPELQGRFRAWAENESGSRRRWAGLAMAAGFPACVPSACWSRCSSRSFPCTIPPEAGRSTSGKRTGGSSSIASSRRCGRTARSIVR